MPSDKIIIATRGSALALAQSNMVATECREKFPELEFELKIIKTTGDKLQTASMARIDSTLPRGLFTKELEVALLNGEADFAVHSLKDLPTELPPGLKLGATPKREDVRDVLIYRGVASGTGRGFEANMTLKNFPVGTVVATSSTRRKAQLLAARSDFKVVEIRGNVATRLEKLANNPEIDATVLAAAGLARLNFQITATGELKGGAIPNGLFAIILNTDEMLPCVGQAAIGIEIRENDPRIEKICAGLTHWETLQAVTAERSFLNAMGGGCQSPVGAHAQVSGETLSLRAISFLTETPQRAESQRPIKEAVALGQDIARQLRAAV
ncbi:MAG: Porphobilinogen deaminase [Verrucomicrobiales bacterium]|nr:Porphobilinogen deaminase [Verrucomicrobiales bacterium]